MRIRTVVLREGEASSKARADRVITGSFAVADDDKHMLNDDMM
jgi:hypothetical protein